MAVASGIAVAGLVVSALVVVRGDGIDHPEEWDERVVDLAAFVEQERGLEFERPVTVEFLNDDEYSAPPRWEDA